MPRISMCKCMKKARARVSDDLVGEDCCKHPELEREVKKPVEREV
jgi:hypothetical protein